MLDYAIVKGRSEPERTYELISEKGKEPKVYNKLLPLWNKAIKLYTKQEWDEAIIVFKKCDKLEEEYIGRPTTPCKVYISRCEKFKAHPPIDDWMVIPVQDSMTSSLLSTTPVVQNSGRSSWGHQVVIKIIEATLF